MGLKVYVFLCAIFICSCFGDLLQLRDLDTVCDNESLLYPPPIYRTLEDAEMSGLRVVDALYGEGQSDYVTGYYQIEELSSIPTTSKSRHKRAITANPRQYWKDALVPYRFDDDVPADEKWETHIAMKRHERFTCVRYIPWVLNQTRWEYDLPDEGHMRLVKRKGCWAFLGNNHSPNGQKISCCSRKACVHELAHIMGVFHDQSSPDRQGWLRINWNNVSPKNWPIFIEEEPSTTLVTRYDLSSIMHYNTYGFTSGGWPAMTVLFKDLASLIDTGGNTFYLWQEIVETNQCQAKHCPGFSLKCVNDGYVSYVEGQCRCFCPLGLDHVTGCRTVIANVTSKREWPSSGFGLFSAGNTCPSPQFWPWDFLTEALLYDQSTNFDLGGNLTDEGVRITMCLTDNSTNTTVDVTFQTGSYCLLASSSDDCPQDFDTIKIPFPGLNFTICCRDDGYTEDPIYLPTDTDFIFMPRSLNGACQSVEGMLGVSESVELLIDPTDIKLSSTWLPVALSGSSRVTISLCYYTKYKTDCGGVIELSKNLQSVAFKSPNHPGSYPQALNCYWLFKGPPKSTIVLDFDDFDVGETGNCYKDYVIIRYALLGQDAPRRCGNKMDQTFTTVHNAMSLHFHSALTANHTGFRGTVRVILPEDYCYNVDDKGASYRGRVNFTRDFQPCLPWDRVKECPHHMFNPRDFHGNLEKNYCRNPDYSFRPWCYTKSYEGQCERNYCDVCRFEKVYDNLPDCEELKQNGLCEKNPKLVLSQCAKTCNVVLPPTEAPSSCFRPRVIYDALSAYYKVGYNVGETVTSKCPYGADDITRRCHSDGTWSPGNYVCGVCSNGWVPHAGACYRFLPQLLTHRGAEDYCSVHNSFLSSANTFDELEFIVTLRPKLRRMWLGSSRTSPSRKWVNSDTTELGISHWAQGAAGVPELKVCAVINPETRNNTFRPESCSSIRPFVCKRYPTPRRVCVNRRWDCRRILRRNPTACTDYPEFAWQQCPFSCGVCEPFSTPFCRVVPQEGIGVIPIGNNTDTYIRRAKFISYMCKPGTVLRRGDLKRICNTWGYLSGNPPECVDETTLTTRNNHVDLVRRKSVGGKFTTYIGNSTNMRIHREGEIIQWRFYANGDGNACLQIWRPRPDLGPMKFDFVGQNYVEYKANRVNTVNVAVTDRIRVLPNDVIGLYSGDTVSQITWNDCGEQVMPQSENSLVLEPQVLSAYFFHIGESYTAKDPTCRTFSVTAYVKRTGRLLSHTSMIPIEKGARKVSLAKNTVYTGENNYFRIRANGSLVEWKLYSQTAGKIALQVWRPRSDIGELYFELIGQNDIQSANDSKQVISVQKAEQIKVQENDVIGMWFGDPPAELRFLTCQTSENPLASPLLFLKHDQEFEIGNFSQFVQLRRTCRVFPVIAVIEENT